jgi:hypothetical protein
VCLPSKCEALSSNPNTIKTKKTPKENNLNLKITFKIVDAELGVVAHTCNPSTGSLKQESHKFETNLGYIVRSSLKKQKVK